MCDSGNGTVDSTIVANPGAARCGPNASAHPWLFDEQYNLPSLGFLGNRVSSMRCSKPVAHGTGRMYRTIFELPVLPIYQ